MPKSIIFLLHWGVCILGWFLSNPRPQKVSFLCQCLLFAIAWKFSNTGVHLKELISPKTHLLVFLTYIPHMVKSARTHTHTRRHTHTHTHIFSNTLQLYRTRNSIEPEIKRKRDLIGRANLIESPTVSSKQNSKNPSKKPQNKAEIPHARKDPQNIRKT